MAALILGYDGSECADAALEAALGFAAELGDSLVVVFGYDPGNITAPDEHRAHQEAVRRYGEEVTAKAMETAAKAGVAAELALIAESPVDALLTAAEEHDTRAIVVGTYGEGPIKSAILGSTPHRLLAWADDPVLVVPAPDADE
jgi:nucleotide-binding universal stress UspA family protein